MRVVVQRSGLSTVSVDNKVVGKIASGLVLLVGFKTDDTTKDIDYMVRKVLNLRIFPDEAGVMNKSILDYGGEILSISQFTLYGNTKNGNRPSYIMAAKPDVARVMYEEFNTKLKEYVKVATGIFQTDMEVKITNIGPTTIIIDSDIKKE